MLIENDIEWPPLFSPQFANYDPLPVPLDREFILPRDENIRILIRIDISIVNEGPGAANLRFSELLTNGDETIREIVLGQGESLDGYLYHVDHSVQEWVDIYSQRLSGSTVEHELTVTSVSAMDTGALDMARIAFGGWILEPVPSLDGHWRIAENPQGKVGTSSYPVYRKYYLSLQENKLLPDYDWESLSMDSGRV